jgi:hypothetical protein
MRLNYRGRATDLIYFQNNNDQRMKLVAPVELSEGAASNVTPGSSPGLTFSINNLTELSTGFKQGKSWSNKVNG